MLLRPVDASGDVLPVLSSSALLSGPEAAARLVQDRLSLLQGEWWENPGLGFPVPERMREGRITGADASEISSQITAYIRETPGVRDAEDVRFSVNGRQFVYSCEIKTEEGSADVLFSAVY
ncbi:MAG: hypothetical protein VZQ29_10225 [Succiniclasticum sp.]|nr:hypothetical protein [Succiniclasticum sp.]